MSWQEDLANANKHRIKGESPKPEQKHAQIVRQSSKLPNKTEERFRLTFLDVWKFQGIITDYAFEDVTLRLASGVRYTPDFAIYRNPTTLEDSKLRVMDFYEVKGGGPIKDDAIVKLKCAAAKYKHHAFWLYQWKGGIWIPQLMRA